MLTARDLALQALRIASDVRSDQIERFEWQSTFFPNMFYVTLYLTDGTKREYSILEVNEGNTPSGEFLPF